LHVNIADFVEKDGAFVSDLEKPGLA